MGALKKINNLEYIEIIEILNDSYALDLHKDDYDGLWVKDLPTADIIQFNKPNGSRGKTSHIAVTSFPMKLFPMMGENWYIVNIDVIKNKIDTSFKFNGFIKSHMAIREATDIGGKHQIYISKKHIDDIHFYSLREQLYVGDQLIILKKKGKSEYTVLSLSKSEIVKHNIPRRGYYFRNDIRFNRDQFRESIIKKLKENHNWYNANEIYELVSNDLKLTKEEKELLSSVANKNRKKYKHIIDDILFDCSKKKILLKTKHKNVYIYSYNDKDFEEYSREAEQNRNSGKILNAVEQEKYKGIRVARSKNNNSSSNKRYSTNSSLKQTALSNAKYMCEYSTLINENHDTFISGTSGKQYMEGHHLVRMCDQEDSVFERGDEYVSLDQIPNIISLCPNCHAKIHFGNESDKRNMITKLYNLKINKLIECDINISLEKLIELYLS